MSGKLDQSLDDIVTSHRRDSTRGSRGRRARPTRSAAKPAPAPVGGVKKNVRGGKPGVKGVPTGPAGGSGTSRVIISGLPKDVGEQQIKEFFGKAVGPIKKVEVVYGPNGVSKGQANVIFVRSESAVDAAKKYNKLQIDGKPITIDVVLDASRIADIPKPKGLGERVTAPKTQPKSAAIVKTASTTNTRGAKARRGRGGRNARPAKKTAEELDTEMSEYWTGATATEGAAAGSGAATIANGDAPMEDEIL